MISNIPVQTDADKTALFLVIEEQKNHIEKLTETIARQEHLIKLLQKVLFGQKSEKIIDTDERQGVFEDILNEVDQLNPPSPYVGSPKPFQRLFSLCFVAVCSPLSVSRSHVYYFSPMGNYLVCCL